MSESRVVIGIDDPALQEEVLHFLDRVPEVRVVGAAADSVGLTTALRTLRPDAAVAVPAVVREAAYLDGARILALAGKETTEGLRAALDVGAHGFYLWPAERDRLARDALGAGRREEREVVREGRVYAVYGPRGGAGVTFLSTNLAAACARLDADTALMDCDLLHGDVATAIGIEMGDETKTVAELIPLLDELTPEHVGQVLYEHPSGFRALLAPSDMREGVEVEGARLARAADVLRSDFDVVLLHLPRDPERARPFLEVADAVLVVLTLDVLAFRGARRALSFLDAVGLRTRRFLIVNKAVRGDLAPKDAERALGLVPTAVINEDRLVPRSQDRGTLVATGRGHAARRVGMLARTLVEGRLE
ncbi:MAG: AAA family ATPase [Actinomycetota bacterium]